MMGSYICPQCKREMERINEPDITIDKCPSCGGVFLERGELNALATGMAGDIEFCSIDDEFHPDKFPLRSCPKCVDQKMKKINLLAFSDLIFDYCDKCGSFFLDKGELQQMNEELKKLSLRGAVQEYRGYRGDHLVRVDIKNDVVIAGLGLAGMVTRPVNSSFICITVYFNHPLPVNLKVFQDKWYIQLAKAFHLLKIQDIPTGNEEFDRLFRVQGDSEEEVRRLLTPDFCKALVEFTSRRPKIYSKPGVFELTRNLISYTEGPYKPDMIVEPVKMSEPIIIDLLNLASLLKR